MGYSGRCWGSVKSGVAPGKMPVPRITVGFTLDLVSEQTVTSSHHLIIAHGRHGGAATALSNGLRSRTSNELPSLS